MYFFYLWDFYFVSLHSMYSGFMKRPMHTVLPADRKILECRVLPKRGCGYVRFSSWEAAEEARVELDNRTATGLPATGPISKCFCFYCFLPAGI